MNREQLIEQIRRKRSFLCVGLDPDLQKMPASLRGDLFAFNRAIIDATAQWTVAYKPNLAFYEAGGVEGYRAFEQTVRYIQEHHPEVMIIADAKRGDIGNTSSMYAKSFFETLNVDALTIAPYMGQDSVTPFLGYPEKWIIVLALTSNPGSADFQHLKVGDGKLLYQQVITKCIQWATEQNLMFVVGATQAPMLAQIRKQIPNHFLLIPGVGAQGGSLEEVAKYGLNRDCGMLVNSSRGIIHASSADDFALVAAQKAEKIQQQMAQILKQIF